MLPQLQACLIFVFLLSGTLALPQSVIPDTCSMPVFSSPAGFYSSPIRIQLLTNTPNSTIFYSLNGAEPTELLNRYMADIPVNATTTIRARCYSAGKVPSPITTLTYLINESITLPVISLAIDPFNLYDPDYGIFVYWEPYAESNLFQDWERPVHVEFFDTDGVPGFSLDAGVKVHGGLTRAQSQKALNIYARKIYGTPKIKYKLFNDRESVSYDAFVLRNGGNDFKWTLFRDEMIHSIFAGVMDLEQAASRPAVVFLNGQYYGIMHIREKVSENFIQDNTNVNSSKIDMLEYPPYITEPKVLNGSVDGYAQLTGYLNTHDLANDDYYKVVSEQIDIQNFINYQIAEIYIDNGDWPGNNIKWWRPNDPVGKWRWILFDTDFGFSLSPFGNESGNQLLHYLHNTLLQATQSTGSAWPNPPASTLLLRSLLRNINFRNRFINTFCDHLNTTFQANRVNALINLMKSVLEPEIPRHHQKYPESAGHWTEDVQVLTKFADERVNNVFNHLMTKFMLQRTLTITLNSSDTSLGTIQINTQVLHSLPFTGRYFPKIPITLLACPKPGNRFKQWSDGDTSLYKVLEVTSALPALNAVFEAATQPNDHAVIINEINYRSSIDFDTKDWAELYNNSDVTIDLSGWVFKDNSDDHSFILPSNLSIGPYSFLIICRNSTNFGILQPEVRQITGDLSFKFSSTGDQLRICNAKNELIDQVSYTSVTPWPDLFGKDGFTLELKDPALDNSLPENWSISSVFAGSPGERNSILLSTHQPQTPSGISRVFPNPFTDIITIEYQVAAASVKYDINVQILNITGQVIKTLIQQQQSPSVYQITWNGTNEAGTPLSGGIYFCRIISFNQKHYHKILLIR